MSSETDFAEFSAAFHRMIERGSRFLPVILSLAAGEANDDQESADQPTLTGQIVIDPVNQRFVVMRTSSGLEDFFNGGEKPGRSPASKASIENLPRSVIGEEDKEKGGSCAICLDEWCEGDVAAEMPCKHKFHSKCVEEWLGRHATCPMCRYEMPVEEVKEEKKFGILIGFSSNGGERRGEEEGGRRRGQSDDSNTPNETEA